MRVDGARDLMTVEAEERHTDAQAEADRASPALTA